MLNDYLQELYEAIRDKDLKAQERIYRALEKLKMDRYTANYLLSTGMFRKRETEEATK